MMTSSCPWFGSCLSFVLNCTQTSGVAMTTLHRLLCKSNASGGLVFSCLTCCRVESVAKCVYDMIWVSNDTMMVEWVDGILPSVTMLKNYLERLR